MEGSSDVSERITRDSYFLNLVFKWSIEDIFDENLYKQKVKTIPQSFDTEPEYFSSFVYPLLEETRAELCSSIEIISRAPFAEVVFYDRAKTSQSLLYDINVDSWKNRFNGRGKEPYKTLPGDIFAIVQSPPETTHDLKLVAQTWVLACVTKLSEHETEDDVDDATSSTAFRIKTSEDLGLLNHDYNSRFVVFLMNITTNKRIWNALLMRENLKIIQGVLSKNTEAEECHSLCSVNNGGLAENLHVELNPSQYEAVLASLQATQCTHKSQVKLVWGPPGTGKTKTLSVLLYSLLKLNCRTLVCAPTNVAITEVAGRVLDLIIKNSSLNNSAGFLGDVLLFGNRQRLKIGSHIEDIYLEYRVKRLTECFAPMTGWRSCFPLLLSFLEKCVSQYDVYVENELIKARDQNINEVDTTAEIKSFLAFTRDRFIAAAKPVRQCIYILQTHASKNCIGQQNLDDMKCLYDLLVSFEEMLFQDDLDSADLLELFSAGGVNHHVDGLLQLDTLRRECISILRTLHRSLVLCNLANIVSKEFLEELCFRTATLVFCTASSSYKLYSLPIKPFSLLVIDEAAQLKECESIIPLKLRGLKNAILFGDECQLPATVISKISCDAGFGRSLFQRLSLLGWSKHLLNMQYRMHPSISAFPNERFYFNQILDAPNVKSKSYERHYLQGPMYGPYSFINISDGREELDEDGRSRRNLVEAAAVVQILQNLYKTCRGSTQKLSVGVVSPYAAQVVAIEEMIGRRYEGLENFRVKVKSVDAFQGGEEDIIIISTVRSNSLGSVGFISDAERTNVALTRARYCLWVLGHVRTLIGSGSIWKALIYNAKERHCFFNAGEDRSLAYAMIEIKKELDQLDDLLNQDSVLFRNARWKVLFSDNFVKTFLKLPSNRVKKSVMNLLVKLSNGWRPKKIKIDPVCESTLNIVKQYKVEGRYVICTNDIQKEATYMQVLKIWDIVPLEDVAKLVKRLDNVYGACTDDFLSRCKERSLERELEVPRTWSTSSDIIRFKSYNHAESTIASDGHLDGLTYAENAKVSESLLLMKFYSLSAGIVGHLLSDFDGRALDLPFEVTDEEHRVILHHKSSFILGRSGTGKTTVLTMKLYRKEQLHHMAIEGLGQNREATMTNTCPDESEESRSVLRQLFVTVSPKLCYAIKQHVSDLKSFARNEGSSTESVPIDIDDIDDRDQFRGIPDSFVNVPPESYPLVITFNKFLLMLDGTLGSSYFERLHDSMKSSDRGSPVSRSPARLMKLKEVNYDKFSLTYWPHFNSQLTKKLDASKVFTEITSSIKGGLQVGQSDDGKLRLEDYLEISEGRTSTLSWKEREMIYHIFLNYEKMKAKRGEFDLADFVNDLHCRLTRERYSGDTIDFVYIDEVQDLTMRQIALFKYLCRNVDEGFVFSGDTAQTIARGIDFRFQDVRCLFFKEFLAWKNNGRNDDSQEKGQISPLFHLNQNFRTHAGILRLGQSIIELIYHFFPHSIDILPPETSRIFGEAPILLESGSDENAIVKIFGNTGNGGGSMVGFGAEQVILVRDDFVREEISDYVGKHALVLTIFECKGLEFQDVLLYNFFGSSPLKDRWRVVYEFMKKQNMLDSTFPQSFPNFDPGKHNVLCSELKQLYVAVTRTRQGLWICENKENLSKPMFDYWKKKCVVQVRQLDDSLAQAMQVASSPEEWKARGKKLLAVHNYEVATMCFERAGDKHWENYAKAAGLKASADRTYHLNVEEAFRILRQAAKLFESINEYRKAADCYYESKEYDKAGKIYLQECGELELERAGECFTAAGNYELAAEVYAKGNLFFECLSSCTEGKLFDLGLQYIQCWKHQASLDQCSDEKRKEIDKAEQTFLENCAHCQYKQNDKRAMMKYVKAFSSEDSMRSFLKTLGCFDELLVLEEELGNFSKAADIARKQGEILLQADLLEKGGLFKEACYIFLWYSFASCLWASGGKGWPLKHYPRKEELLLKAKSCAFNTESHLLYETVCVEIMILLNRSHSLSKLKQFLIMSKNHKSLRGEILSTRRILDTMLQSDVSKYQQESDLIDDFATYSLQSISANRISVESLMYFWASWKETVLAIVRYLGADEGNETSNLAKYGKFGLNYLGVWKQASNMSTVYVCLYPDAEWVKEVDKRFLHEFGKLVSIEEHQFLVTARNHWCAELMSTGLKVLDILSAFQNYAIRTCLSALSKIKTCIHVYEISHFLYSLKCMKQRHCDMKLLESHIQHSTGEFFDAVFPLDWRKSVSKDMVLLRERDISTGLLEEVIVKNTSTKDDLTYRGLGLVSMVLLGSHKCRNELFYDMVLRRLDIDSPWKSFLESLRSGISNGTMSFHVANAQNQLKESLAFKLHGALKDVYAANWRSNDYISPHCFLYLVERLMISLLEFRGTVVITRSTLVEWLIHRNWKATFCTDLVTCGSSSAFVGETYHFLANIVNQLLVGIRDTVEWVKTAGINAKENFPLLLLRLVLLMSLLHLNTGTYWDLLVGVINRKDITGQLPPGFWNVLQKWRKVGFNNAVSEALKEIEDPLVVVSIGNFRSNLSCKNAIFLNMINQNRKDLLRILFPDKVEGLHARGQGLQPANMNGGSMEFNDGNIWEFFNALELIENGDRHSEQRFISRVSEVKVQVDKAYNLMTSAVTRESENNNCTDEPKKYATEADCLLLELQLLSATLDVSGQQLKDSMLLIKDISRKVLSGKPVFEHFLAPVIPPLDRTACLTNSEEKNASEGGDDNDPKADEDSSSDKAGEKVDSSAVPPAGNQSNSQGNEKNKGKQQVQASQQEEWKKIEC